MREEGLLAKAPKVTGHGRRIREAQESRVESAQDIDYATLQAERR